MTNVQESKSSKKSRKFSFRGGFRRKGKKEDKFAPREDAGDDNTVYSVALEASSKVSAAQSVPVGDPIHVILLLMDPITRRFELLQLEFDSSSAKVSDIFSQISVSATEPSLKNQQYEALVNIKGDELLSSKNLVEYFDSAGIVIAVPSTTKESGQVIAKMANPILSNPNVHNMLMSSGLDIPDLPPPVVKGDKKANEQPVIIAMQPNKAKKNKILPTLSLFGIAALAVAVRLILKVHIHYTTPLGPGDVLAPGRSRGFCGLTRLSPTKAKCEPMSMSMGLDGVFQVIKNGEVLYELTGKECTGDGCIAGLSIDKDGKVKINGSRVKTTSKAKVALKPWPFAEDVVLPKSLF